jgi:hypothetical protein
VHRVCGALIHSKVITLWRSGPSRVIQFRPRYRRTQIPRLECRIANIPRSRGAGRPRFVKARPSRQARGRREDRAPAGARGPRAADDARGRNHRFSREYPAFPARWFERLLRALPGVPGLIATIARATRKRRRELDTSVGVSGPHGLAVRKRIVRPRSPRERCAPSRPPLPASTSVTTADRPSA